MDPSQVEKIRHYVNEGYLRQITEKIKKVQRFSES